MGGAPSSSHTVAAFRTLPTNESTSGVPPYGTPHMPLSHAIIIHVCLHI
jgi:hypothetical protein